MILENLDDSSNRPNPAHELNLTDYISKRAKVIEKVTMKHPPRP